MKILLAVIVFAGFTTTAMAQGGAGDDATVTANAQILVALDLDHNGTNVDFGAVQVGNSPALDPTNVEGDNHVEFAGIGERSVARFTVTGAAGAQIQFSGQSAITLSNDTHEMTFTPDFSYSEEDSNDDRGGNGYNLGEDVNLDENGKGTIWMGGNLGTIANISAGEYTGEYTLSVVYN